MYNDAPLVVQRAYDFNLWLMQKVLKFPRPFRANLGDRLTDESMDLLLLLIDAAYSAQKEQQLADANRRLNAIRYLLPPSPRLRRTGRMAKDMNFMAISSFGFAVESIDEIGRMVGGWRKEVAKRK